MDILNSVKEQVSLLKKRTNKIDLSDLIMHLDRAEYFYNQGREEEDEHFYTDVIYRTNQAFEGILREGYKILSKQEKKRINTYDIEKYFLTNGILKNRVLQFFTVYRQNWRNESAHDYKLFFSESEALMAITSVTTFAYVLINQILEALAYQTELTADLDTLELSKIANDESIELDEKLIALIKLFIANNEELIDKNDYKEYEFVGLFTGFLDSLNRNSLKVIREPKLGTDSFVNRPDLLIEEKNEKAIVEFKGRRNENLKDADRTNIIKYLWTIEGVKIGIIFYMNRKKAEEIQIERNILTDYDQTYKIIEVY